MASKESLEKNVNHPLRYTKGKVECIDALESAVAGKSPEDAICVANVIKYLWRYEEKEPLRSLMSARWYLDRLIGKYEESFGKYEESCVEAEQPTAIYDGPFADNPPWATSGRHG